jgi:hypothetical protein
LFRKFVLIINGHEVKALVSFEIGNQASGPRGHEEHRIKSTRTKSIERGGVIEL